MSKNNVYHFRLSARKAYPLQDLSCVTNYYVYCDAEEMHNVLEAHLTFEVFLL